jgi:hypothetical protein
MNAPDIQRRLFLGSAVGVFASRLSTAAQAGAKGPVGPAGPIGPAGPQGPPGPVPEAPQDGKTYGRNNAAWSQITTGTGGAPATSRFGLNVLDFGADPTGQNDSVDAFERAMLAAAQLSGTAPPGYTAQVYGRIAVPLGQYKFSRACNLDIIQTLPGKPTATGYHFIGEATRWQGGSVIVGPPNDYAFKSTIFNVDGVSAVNIFSTQCFENLFIMGYGGIYIKQGTPTVRNCWIEAWRCIVGSNCWSGAFENLVLRGRNDWNLPISNDRDKGQVGLFVFGSPNITIQNIDASLFTAGTAVALSGAGITAEGIHCEVNRVGVLLGYSHLGPNYDYLSYSSIRQVSGEANIILLLVSNFGPGEIKQIFGQAHQEQFPDGAHTAFCSVMLGNCAKVELANSGFVGGHIQSACVTSQPTLLPPDQGPAIARVGWGATFIPAPGNYPAGTRVLPIFRGKSVRMPQWLVPGIGVKIGSKIPSGTTVTSVSSTSITLSVPTTGAITCDSALNASDWIEFTDAQGKQLGELDVGYPFPPVGLAPI